MQKSEPPKRIKKFLRMWASKPMQDRFWARTKQNGDCLEWTGPLNRFGYGVNGRVLAHRMAYFLSSGSLCLDDCVMHSCDNRKCINPQHLRAGSHAENMADMREKGRRKGINTGERNGRAALTQDAAEQIRRERQRGVMLKELAARYGVGLSTISRVSRGENWKQK